MGAPSHVPLLSLRSEEALEKISYENLPKDDSKLQGYRPAAPPAPALQVALNTGQGPPGLEEVC